MKQYFEKFESVTEFIHTIDTRNVRESFEDKQHSQTKDFEFTGTFSYEEANNLFLYGDKKNADKLNEALRKIKAQGRKDEVLPKLLASSENNCSFLKEIIKFLQNHKVCRFGISSNSEQNIDII